MHKSPIKKLSWFAEIITSSAETVQHAQLYSAPSSPATSAWKRLLCLSNCVFHLKLSPQRSQLNVLAARWAPLMWIIRLALLLSWAWQRWQVNCCDIIASLAMVWHRLVSIAWSSVPEATAAYITNNKTKMWQQLEWTFGLQSDIVDQSPLHHFNSLRSFSKMQHLLKRMLNTWPWDWYYLAIVKKQVSSLPPSTFHHMFSTKMSHTKTTIVKKTQINLDTRRFKWQSKSKKMHVVLNNYVICKTAN